MATAHTPQNDYTDAVAVTPNDGVDLASGQTRGLWIGTATAAQTLSVVMASGNTVRSRSAPPGRTCFRWP